MNKSFTHYLFVSALMLTTLNACDDSDEGSGTNNKIDFTDKSVNPSLVYAMPGFESKLKISTLISSDDVLPESPGFIFGAQPDGAGLMKNPDGKGYIMINNHEIHWAVSRIYLDETFKPVKGEYIMDADGGGFRLCSATLATPDEHGFGPLFLTAGESSEESLVHAIDPLAAADKKTSRTKPALGRANMENAVPLPKAAYPGKTLVFMGEDQSFTSAHQSAGQLIMYMSNTVGDLDNGDLYVLKRTDNNTTETDMVKGQQYDVQFVKVNTTKATKDMSGKDINTANIALNAIRFSRVEDVDYRKGSAANNRQVYFTATGQSPDRVNPQPGFTMWGRVYRLTMDAADPLKGKLELAIDGDAEAGNGLINPDNLCVTENFVYTQEDGDSFYTNAQHDSYIWQYRISTGENKAWLNMNHRRDDAAFNAKYNTAGVNVQTTRGYWEFGAMYDISDIIGVPETFIVNIHPHSWLDNKFKNPDVDGANKLTNNTEGGQIVVVRGVDK